MNDQNPVPPPFFPSSQRPELGDAPEERVPIPNGLVAIECVLRHPRRLMFQLRQPGAGPLIAAMFAIAVVCSLTYGVVVGTFSGHTQLWAAPVKITAGLMVSALICLPSLYIFNCLSGSRARLMEVCGLLAALLMLMTLLLAGFAPVAWVFSQSTASLAWMGALHIAFGLASIFFGLRFVEAGFVQSKAKSTAGFNLWAVILVLVVLQMTTALRPIIGTAPTFLPTEKKFFLTHWHDFVNEPDKPVDKH